MGHSTSQLKREDVKRLYKIASVMMDYGFGPWLDGFVQKHKSFVFLKALGWYRKSENLGLPNEIRMRKALEDLGPIFIKLGQTLSTRADLFEPRYIKELSKLQDDDPPFPWEDARRILTEEFGKPPEEFFKHIDEKPMSSASIGQVHGAILKNGERAIVKILRPGIVEVMEQDLRIMRYLVTFFMRNNPDWVHYNPDKILDEFSESLMLETDYRHEAMYAQAFGRNFEGYPGVRVPKVYLEYTTERVLVLERLEGISMKEFIAKADPKRKKAVLDAFVNCFLKQIFEDRFFHGDPHPSNLMLLEDDTLAFLDFGNMKRMTEKSADILTNVLQGLTSGDMEAMEGGFEECDIVPYDADRKALIRDMESLYVTCFLGKDRCDVSKTMEDMTGVFRKHKLMVPYEYGLLIRSVAEAEGVSKQLDPKFFMYDYVGPYFKELTVKRITNMASIDNISRSVHSIVESLSKLPDNLRALSKRLGEGTIGIELRHQSLNDLTLEMDRVSNRISASILLAAIMVGSALIMQAGITSSLVDIPALGAIGFFLAMLLGFWMVLRIIRRSGI